MSKVQFEDLEQIISDCMIPWEKLQDKAILVTGASGVVGSALIHALSYASKRHGLGARIIGVGRDRKKVRKLITRCGLEFIEQDIRNPLTFSGNVDYIFHCAAVTKSSEMVLNPVGVVETSIKGTDYALKLAREKCVKSMVYLSSMEVYGITDPAIPRVSEDNLGYIDIKNPRSCYPESKRICECLCSCWFAQYGVPVKTARLAQTFGAGIPVEDSRVFAQFARSVIAGEDIILHTEGNSRGNYCYISDTVRGLLYLLLMGENGEAYNIVNPDASMTIREMAELVAIKIGQGRASVVVYRPEDVEALGYAPDTTLRLSSEKLERLGWRPRYGLEEMYRRMILDWEEQLRD